MQYSNVFGSTYVLYSVAACVVEQECTPAEEGRIVNDLWRVISASDGDSAMYSALAGQASYERIHHTFSHKANLCGT